jgi:hypothetical protein
MSSGNDRALGRRMRTRVLLGVAVALGVVSGVRAADNPNLAKISVGPDSWQIPEDFFSALVGDARDLDGLQHDFDVYSWRTFIALNWPADAQGEARRDGMIGRDGNAYTTVWETWRSVPSIFLEDGSQPAPWGQKGASLVTFEEPFDTGPLIDRAGRHARFDILVNRDMFEFIVQRRLYSIEGQNAYKALYGNIVFPCGHRAETTAAAARPASVGSILIKAAWKELSPNEAASGRFFMRRMAQHEEGTGKTGGHELILGLVGLHIVHKSEDVPEWNWSTFEQIDNVPTRGEVLGHPDYSFFSNVRDGLSVNAPPAPPWNPGTTESLERRSRIVRQQPLSDEVKRLNEEAHQQLRQVNAASVWQFYQLISTQWPTRPARVRVNDPKVPAAQARQACDVLAISPTDITGGPAPVYLGNSTLESYIQGQVPNASSSCMDCHANATAGSGEFSDFTYILTRAHAQGKLQ